MDAKVLIIISLGSLVLIIGAVAALWLRARRGSSISPGGTQPTAPAAPARQRNEDSLKKMIDFDPKPIPLDQEGNPDWEKMTDGQIIDAIHRGEDMPDEDFEVWHNRKEQAAQTPPSAPAPVFGGVPPPPSTTQPPAPPPPPPMQAPGAPPLPVQPAPAQPKSVEPETTPQVNEVDGYGSSEYEDFTSKPVKPGESVPLAGQYEVLDSIPPPPAPITPSSPAPEPIDDKPKMDESGEETEASLPADWLSEEESTPLADVIPELPYLEGGFDDDDFSAEPISQSPAKDVLFSAYYPKEIAPEKWEPLHAYIFRAMATAAVEADAGKQLGSRAAEFRGVRVPAKAEVPEGALVTATPQMAGFQFNPPSVTSGFYKDWHRFDFEVRAKDAPIQQSTNGLLTFTVEGIIIADVPLSIFLGETTSPASTQTNTVAKAYESVFCSYSHKDQHIVARAERAYKALGLDYLRDVVSLKSGQDWSDELLTLINRADIFQLFWSMEAAQSEHVRFEWEHALQVAGWRANFIRPVYWQDPKPHIPDELKHIHFAYQPDLDT
jgi:hypothetical protein